jgi:hypothetical protein
MKMVDKVKETSVNFLIDHRQSNPALHKLHVIWAQEVVATVNQAVEDLMSFSQIQPSILGGTLQEAFAKIVLTEASYQEAVWRVATHQLLVRDKEPDHGDADQERCSQAEGHR